MGWLSDIFGGGGGGGSSSSSVSTSTNSTTVTVNPTTNVGFEISTEPLQKALDAMTGVQSKAMDMAIAAKTDSAETVKTLIQGFQDRMDSQGKMQLLIAGAGLALTFMKGK